MKIPIFEEILLSEVSSEKLRIIVSDSRIGKVPCYLNLSIMKKDDVENMIINLEQIILDHNLHPLFPYPLYIVTPHPVKSIFPVVRTVKDLPEHYFKKVKRPNNKELQLLNKLSLKVDKIKNLELYKILNEFRRSSFAQRKLYNETKELYFLETLNSKLFEKGKK
ncbi:MAG: hypothetical protein WC635_00590 [Bacteriovorax sp.]|jgi:hypothetical protein